jgi:putative methionine-R-sulfoxide reductase with GAF domain
MFQAKTMSAIVSKISSLPKSIRHDELVAKIIESIPEWAGLYFVSIYLLDSTGEWAMFRAGTGEAGQKMLRLGHKYRVGTESLVGRAIHSGEIQLLDYYDGVTRFVSPNLPETRWELALPLRVEEQIMGVLEIEGSKQADFTLEDTKPLQQVADAVARKIRTST